MTDLHQVTIDQERFYQIRDSDKMRPFFMSIVSDANHWMFIASNGGLTAGRKNSEYALFPYYTDDKITESAETTGCKTIIRTTHAGKTTNWEPFSVRNAGRFGISRNLYKSVHGNQIVFEEINNDLGLSFRYRWSSSNRFGFLRTATLHNHGGEERSVSLVDGLQNLLPYGVGSELQMRSSNLADAYKRNELHTDSGLGIFALSAIIVDKAEPSEALKANTVWSQGLDEPTYLLSSRQLEDFRQGKDVHQETDVKGEKGAYLLSTEFTLAADTKREWHIVANVNQDRSAVAQLIQELEDPEALVRAVTEDVRGGTRKLVGLSAAADGIQLTADQRRDTRHFSNVLFNIMRGGIFDDNYQIERADFSAYLQGANTQVQKQHRAAIDRLGEIFSLSELLAVVNASGDPDLIRLGTEYLPLKFSRRHGDPSRPWNKFSINTHNEADGSKILDYEGNWRDIFQNWEALAHSYPDFMKGMIFKFLNASTFDGYNPYRVTKGGFDWETIEEDDPWSYIGYWGDHQIIYLLKFLEFSERYRPGELAGLFDERLFTYANVPYKLHTYREILKQPKDTVDFDRELDEEIRERRKKIGADGALMTGPSGDIYRVSFVEKILATLLAKVANFIPEGGIWMNTQRPEWNDANNALVGNGISMVTLYYLRRFVGFLDDLLATADGKEFAVSAELAELFQRTVGALRDNHQLLDGSIDDRNRKKVLDALGQAASDYRRSIYEGGFSGTTRPVSATELREFVRLCRDYFDHTIRANRRDDGLYHAYNLVTPEAEEVKVSYLAEMLEGQVAILSADYLSSGEALGVMDALKASALFREDQYSYILYPNKNLPGFLEKNEVPARAVEQSELLGKLLTDGNGSIVRRDVNGAYHFNGNFTNVGDLNRALDALAGTDYADLAKQERKQLQGVFEQVFNHKEFTGRSGTFFGYEGLGSIYWHMVSKLQLAVQECCLNAIREGAGAEITGRMIAHYYEILEGTGVHKSPELYGAFPTDPYSHTPAGKGAQQPGMTGQVKEDILNRFGELGIGVTEGRLSFSPTLLRRDEFLNEPATYDYVDVSGRERSIGLEAGDLAFTYCQVPVVYRIGEQADLRIVLADGSERNAPDRRLDTDTSRQLFGRTGEIARIRVTHPATDLK